MPTDIYQVHESDLSQCVPPVNGYTYTVYVSNSLTSSEGTTLYNQTTLTISDIEQGETYVIAIIAVNNVGEGEPAMTTISELHMLIYFRNCCMIYFVKHKVFFI